MRVAGITFGSLAELDALLLLSRDLRLLDPSSSDRLRESYLGEQDDPWLAPVNAPLTTGIRSIRCIRLYPLYPPLLPNTLA